MLTAALFGSAIGCATAGPVVRLQPMTANPVWSAGLAVIGSESNGIRAAAAFVRQQGEMIAIRVEVENRGAQPVLVEPSGAYFQHCFTTQSGASNCRPTEPVKDPEKMLLELDLAERRQEASHANSQGVESVFLLLGLVTAVGAVATGDGAATDASLNNVHHSSERMEQNDASHARATGRIHSERQLWDTDALRRTTLPPGGAAAGMIYLPIYTGAARVRLVVPVGPAVLLFEWSQTVYLPAG